MKMVTFCKFSTLLDVPTTVTIPAQVCKLHTLYGRGNR